LIDRYFKLAENKTSVKQEMLGGLTTFVTMAYIIVVNPKSWLRRECRQTAWSLRRVRPPR
jgi:xanthine/uracil/vitamin C permease (AzgA family)